MDSDSRRRADLKLGRSPVVNYHRSKPPRYRNFPWLRRGAPAVHGPPSNLPTMASSQRAHGGGSARSLSSPNSWFPSAKFEASGGASDRKGPYIPSRGRHEALELVCYVLEVCGGERETFG